MEQHQSLIPTTHCIGINFAAANDVDTQSAVLQAPFDLQSCICCLLSESGIITSLKSGWNENTGLESASSIDKHNILNVPNKIHQVQYPWLNVQYHWLNRYQGCPEGLSIILHCTIPFWTITYGPSAPGARTIILRRGESVHQIPTRTWNLASIIEAHIYPAFSRCLQFAQDAEARNLSSECWRLAIQHKPETWPSGRGDQARQVLTGEGSYIIRFDSITTHPSIHIIDGRFRDRPAEARYKAPKLRENQIRNPKSATCWSVRAPFQRDGTTENKGTVGKETKGETRKRKSEGEGGERREEGRMREREGTEGGRGGDEGGRKGKAGREEGGEGRETAGLE
ncbi:hypothetical protein B0H13DRAFT_2422672 [Mycena leptocephala]|nr:hypothetical protein B0H13DRAFT_2422672 [Mycena leptocephala]